MKKNTHKYFVNQRHKNKLEARSHGFRTYWSHVKYYTKEPDTRDIRESMSSILWTMERKDMSMDEAIQDHIEWYNRHTNGRFLYYERPEVPYTIHKVHTSPSYSRRRKELCREANRRVRHHGKQYGEIYQGNLHKRLSDVAWDLD